MPEFEPFNFTSRASLDDTLATYCADQLKTAIQQKGHAAMAVSGGSTPRAFFQILSGKELDWDKVTITLADERWVDNQDEASNERLVRENLLQRKAARAQFLPVKNAAASPHEGQQALAKQLRQLGPMDLLILGMGTDGHTASLFPKASELSQAIDPDNAEPCQAVTPVTAPHKRMTMTLSWLLQSKDIILHITGSDKRYVLEHALRAGPTETPPIGVLLRRSPTPVKVYFAP